LGFRRPLSSFSVASVSAIAAAVHLSSSRSLSPDYSTRRPPTLPLLPIEVEFFFFFSSFGGLCFWFFSLSVLG
jgi:hypothetical protein